MKIAILGYGKMGQEIENLAIKRGHEIVITINNLEDWDTSEKKLIEADLAIDFSTPGSIVDNIYRCFNYHLPIVIGTTGWFDDLEKVREDCLKNKQSIFFSPNFSIGVNLFFELNRLLARLMSKWENYEISIEETHHIHKQDAPSGTAIVLANDIIQYIERKDKWVNDDVSNPEEVGIKSFRTDNVPGTHVVRYESEDDSIEIVHTAKSRRGFAFGAILAAEWLAGKTGFFEMKDMLVSQIIQNQE
ncbi:MAG: 4-hydroxy-tetrahydrodipicolinate reductase [Bacteroidales bacterium]|nr:4-hydroxy-tetrahydrodipicolinate reductase [Bacteroidales bacterium]MDD4603085.1 4-hydroxy-tetrahydrodipicolinate reductase [Bacteroidales bacterium]